MSEELFKFFFLDEDDEDEDYIHFLVSLEEGEEFDKDDFTGLPDYGVWYPDNVADH